MTFSSEPVDNPKVAADAVAGLVSKLRKMARAQGIVDQDWSMHIEQVFSETEGTSTRRWRHRAEQPMKPASCQKLLTATAFIDRLGLEAELRTDLLYTGKLDAGLVQGNLVVVGGGDPGRVLAIDDATAVFAEWLSALRAQGVTQINGDIIVDDRYLAGPQRHPDWPRKQYAKWYSAPSGALNLNDNCHDVQLRMANAKLKYQIMPSCSLLEVTFTMKATAHVKKHRIVLDRAPGSWQLRIRGAFWQKRKAWLGPVAVADASLAYGYSLKDYLDAHGIKVTGQVLRQAVPEQAVLLHQIKRAAKTYLPRLLKDSQNVYADCLARVLAKKRGGDGSFSSVQSELQAFGRERWAWQGHISRDGSGLSHKNRLSAEQLVQLLQYVDKQSWANSIFQALPVAGVDGTLRKRFKSGSLRGKVVAKTGHLSGVATLAGKVELSDRKYFFALMFQRGDSRAGSGRADRFFEAALGEFVTIPQL